MITRLGYSWVWAWFLIVFALFRGAVGTKKPIRIVAPVDGETKLAVDEDGLRALELMEGSIAPVVVIGPYRSGKSFLLNQLVGQPCQSGFEVGHQRNTQTRGVWTWTEPTTATGTGSKQTSIIYVDTEGFEATRKADAYDDRIFALSAILGSVLIYNLPETIKEADLEKLSFAVQLADVFYSDALASTDSKRLLEPASLLWLIQRDFLQGSTVADMVNEALQDTPNPDADPGINQVNQVRQSLRLMTSSNTAFSLTQPHMNRTALCSMKSEDFDPKYNAQIIELRSLIRTLAKPKVINGRPASGVDLANLIRKVVAALNTREIPSAAAVIESFNQEVLQRCVEVYETEFGSLQFPTEAREIEARHEVTYKRVMGDYYKERFRSVRMAQGLGDPLEAKLKAQLDKTHKQITERNELASATACEDLGTACETVFELNDRMTLPTIGKFQDRYTRCKVAFDDGCVGPARHKHASKLEKRYQREFSTFQKGYNDRLLNGITMLAIMGVLLGRFIIRSGLLELASWGLFLFFQIAPRLSFDKSLYDSTLWKVTTATWERVIFNRLLDLDSVGIPLFLLIVCTFLGYRGLRWVLRATGYIKGPPPASILDVDGKHKRTRSRGGPSSNSGTSGGPTAASGASGGSGWVAFVFRSMGLLRKEKKVLEAEGKDVNV